MKSTHRNKSDYYGGALMILIGLAALAGASSYTIGTPSHMGPGFFPAVLGALLALVGATIAACAGKGSARAASIEGQAHGGKHRLPDLRGGACIVLGILAFLGVGTYGGLLPATFLAVFIAALGDRANTVRQAVVLALGMSLVAAVVFSWALQLQLPLFCWG